MKDLFYKLVTLLDLTFALRASICLMAANPDHVKFVSSKLHKSWKKRQRPPSVLLYGYKEGVAVFVTSTIKVYLARTKTWQQENN